jgi:hypothetical protein
MLQLILDDFTWQRPASRRRGFKWEGTGEDLRLVQVSGAAFNSYQPHPGIFRDFADLQQTPEAVLNFANRYGGLRERLDFNAFPNWRHGIQHFQQLVGLNDALTGNDWTRIPKALEPLLADASLAESAEIRQIHLKRKRGENVSLNEQVHVVVMRLCRAIAPAERFAAEGSWNSLTGKVELRLKHADLLDFMFYQLGHAFIGGRRFRQCTVCGKWSLLTPGVNRADRTTCSGYCRVKRCRQRRAKALELQRMGRAPRSIAKEIGSDVSKVKEWLSDSG